MSANETEIDFDGGPAKVTIDPERIASAWGHPEMAEFIDDRLYEHFDPNHASVGTVDCNGEAVAWIIDETLYIEVSGAHISDGSDYRVPTPSDREQATDAYNYATSQYVSDLTLHLNEALERAGYADLPPITEAMVRA